MGTAVAALGLVALSAAQGIQPSHLAVVKTSAGQPCAVVAMLDTAPDPFGGTALLAESMSQGTSDMTAADLRAFSLQAGAPIRIEAFEQSIRITIQEPAGGLSTAVSLLDSLLRRALLDDVAISRARVVLRSRRAGPWAEALLPSLLQSPTATDAQVRQLYAIASRPERVWIACADQDVESATLLLRQQFGEWRPTQTPATRPARQPSRGRNPTVGSLQMYGQPGSLGGSNAARTLAMFALGVGKGGLLHRLLREREGWSYRQEALFWPTASGWQPRLVVLASGSIDAKAALEALFAGVAGLAAADLARAKAMARSALEGALPVSPFWGGLSGPIGNDPAGRAAFALTELTAGARLDESQLLKSLTEVSLADMKAAAAAFLSQAATVQVPSGR